MDTGEAQDLGYYHGYNGMNRRKMPPELVEAYEQGYDAGQLDSLDRPYGSTGQRAV